MIPYFLALFLIGIPLMWMEWTIGRHGGGFGHGSTPGMLHRLWRHPISKYLGIFGILLPAMIGVYYIYIESWSLGYAWQTMRGTYWGRESYDDMKTVFTSYTGIQDAGFFCFSPTAYLFFIITFCVNMFVFTRGIARGIEIVAKYCVPMLLVIGVILAVRVLTLPPVEGRSISDGLAQIWSVKNWSVLTHPNVWIAASGQIFFTLSVGLGMIHTYASYLKKREDIALSGLAACGTNEFVEVILGSTIAIPAAVIFFGVAETRHIAEGGTFSLGFYSLPVIFQKMPGTLFLGVPSGQFFGTLWFVLLFLAGLTSSMAMFTPLLVFLEDELQIPRKKSVPIIMSAVFLIMQPMILFMHHGIIDEMDYWVGEFGLILFVAIESVIFAWIFGMKKGWEEIHLGAELQIPKIFYYIMKFVTPTYVLALLGWYLHSGFWDKITMKGVAPADMPYLWLARGIMLSVVLFLVWGVWHAWRTHPKFFDDVEKDTEETAS